MGYFVLISAQHKKDPPMSSLLKVSLLPVLLVVALGGCALTSGGGGNLIKPPDASVSPKMDFAKIHKIGIFPLFPTKIEEGTFAENLIGALSAEVSTRQSQWETVSYRDLLATVNKNGLGTGYKNLQADFNTSYNGPSGQMVLGAASRAFLKSLQKVTGVDAFLIGSYSFVREQIMVKGLFGPSLQTRDHCTVQLTLFFAPESEAWWTASIGRYGSQEGVVKEIAQSLAANLGKGVLRQL